MYIIGFEGPYWTQSQPDSSGGLQNVIMGGLIRQHGVNDTPSNRA